MTPDENAHYRRLRGLWGFASALAWVGVGMFALRGLGGAPAYLFLVVLSAPIAFAIGAYFARTSLFGEFRAAQAARTANEKHAHQEVQQRQEAEAGRKERDAAHQRAHEDFTKRLQAVDVALDTLPSITQSQRAEVLGGISRELEALRSNYDQALTVEILADRTILTELANALTRLKDIGPLSPEALALREAVKLAVVKSPQ